MIVNGRELRIWFFFSPSHSSSLLRETKNVINFLNSLLLFPCCYNFFFFLRRTETFIINNKIWCGGEHKKKCIYCIMEVGKCLLIYIYIYNYIYRKKKKLMLKMFEEKLFISFLLLYVFLL